VLIGLHGKKQAGKDTVYERAAHIMRGVVPVERASFADLLYRSAAAALGVSEEFLREHKSDPRYTVVVMVPGPRGPVPFRMQTLREFLQRYGTEAHRDVFGENFWVECVRLAHEGRIVMVTDVRFKNEAETVRRAGGAVVHVVGPTEIEEAGDGHASEATLSPGLIDAVLRNDVRDDNFRALDRQVDTLLRLGLGGSL